MNADRTLVEFGKVQYLMDRLFEFDLGCETIGKIERIGLYQFAVSSALVYLGNRKILSSQFADGYSHPAFLIGMVVHA
jgi:hypothetical protein